MVALDGVAPVSRAWLLTTSATFAALHPVIPAEAVKTAPRGRSIDILERRLEPAVDMRNGLLTPWTRWRNPTTRQEAHDA